MASVLFARGWQDHGSGRAPGCRGVLRLSAVVNPSPVPSTACRHISSPRASSFVGRFLCDADGVPIKRYAPTTSPLSIEPDIVALL